MNYICSNESSDACFRTLFITAHMHNAYKYIDLPVTMRTCTPYSIAQWYFHTMKSVCASPTGDIGERVL